MATWHAKQTYGYLKTSTEAKENAELCYGVLASLGYCLEAVAATLGNQGGESEYNPWRWEAEHILTYNESITDTSTSHGYGLFQFTPSKKYTTDSYATSLSTFSPNFADRSGQPHDGDAQLRYMHRSCVQNLNGEWDENNSLAQGLGMPYADFIANTRNYTVAQLTRTFFGCYERGTWSVGDRANTAEYWYDYLGGITPPTPPTPTGRKLPLIFYLKHKPF